MSRGGNRSWPWLASALIVLLGLLGAACSDEPDDSSQGFAAPFRSTSPDQAELLADGELTLAEYENAFLPLVACLEDRGIRVIDTEFVDSRGFNYSTMDPDTPEGQAKFDSDHNVCRSQHFDDIALAWAYINADPDADAAFYEAVADCVRGTSPAELDAAIQRAPVVYDQCLEKVRLESLP